MKLPSIANLIQPAKPEVYLGLIVGSHAIKATIFSPPQKLQTEVKILGRSEQKQGFTAMRGSVILDLDAVLECADLSIEQAQMTAGVLPQKTILGVFGGSIKATGMAVRLTRAEKDAPVSSKELHFLLEKIKQKTLPQAQGEIAGQGQIPWQHLETFLIQYRLDGKIVTSPVGLGGQTFEALLVHTFIKSDHLKTWRLFIKELNLEALSLLESSLIWTFPLLSKQPEGVLIDVGGDTTEVMIFKNGKIYGNESFSLGGRVLTEEIARRFSLSFDQTEELKIKSQQGDLDQERTTQVRASVKEPLLIWVKGLEVTLQNLESKVRPLPPNFLLTGGGARLPEVKSTLLTHPWNRVLNLSAFPKIENLTENVLYQGLNYVQGLLTPQ